MRPCRLLSTSLLLCALAGGVPVLAAADVPAKTSAAQELMRQRKPKEAIPQLIKIIEEKRDKLEESADALIQLVQCFQLLKGDAAAEKQYAELSAKYLSKPPALDGKSLPTVDQASEDLLWKAWTAGQDCRYSFATGRVQRELTLETQDGPATSEVTVTLNTVDATPSPANDREIAEMEKHQRGLDAAGKARLRMEIERQRARGAASKLTGADGDDPFGRGWDATAKIGGRNFQGTASFSFGGLRIVFKGLPEDAQLIDELTATLRLAQPRQMEDTLVPLRKGATWTAGDEVGTVTDVVVRGKATTVKLSTKSQGKRRGGGASASSSSTSIVGGGMAADPGETESDAPICLVTPEGRLFTPNGMSSSSINGNATMEMTFHGADKADKLRLRRTAAMSVREVPLKVTGIKLP